MLDAEIENVLINGDLSRLSPTQRVAYYQSICTSLGLNPVTRPFDYLTLSGRLTLYAKKDATDQLRFIHGISITGLEESQPRQLGTAVVYRVTAHAKDRNGRVDASTGVVELAQGIRGEALANAMMKAETKAKRRVTLSICGLGMLDETEVSTIRDAVRTTVNFDTGEVEQMATTPMHAEAHTGTPPRNEPARVETSTREQVRDTYGEPANDGPTGAASVTNEQRSAADGRLRVSRLRIAGRGTNARGPWTRYVVHLTDGREASTFSSTHAEVAREAGASGTPVEVTIEQAARGLNLTHIEPVFHTEDEDTSGVDMETGEVLDDVDNDADILDEIPF